MQVRQRRGIPASAMRYSIRAPSRIAIGRAERMRNPSHGGVSVPRFAASAKNAKTRSIVAGNHCSRSSV
jgi:hypothetical protein